MGFVTIPSKNGFFSTSCSCPHSKATNVVVTSPIIKNMTTGKENSKNPLIFYKSVVCHTIYFFVL